MAKYIMSPEQRSYLRALVAQQRKLDRQHSAHLDTKRQLDEMVGIARAMGISNSRIARALHVSDARISQIKKKELEHGIGA
jgi:predicted nucleotidyltransferase